MKKTLNLKDIDLYLNTVTESECLTIESYLSELKKTGQIVIHDGIKNHFSNIIKMIWDFDCPEMIWEKKKKGKEIQFGFTPQFHFVVITTKTEFSVNIFPDKASGEEFLVSIL